jgi:hypothetical protein
LGFGENSFLATKTACRLLLFLPTFKLAPVSSYLVSDRKRHNFGQAATYFLSKKVSHPKYWRFFLIEVNFGWNLKNRGDLALF